MLVTTVHIHVLVVSSSFLATYLCCNGFDTSDHKIERVYARQYEVQDSNNLELYGYYEFLIAFQLIEIVERYRQHQYYQVDHWNCSEELSEINVPCNEHPPTPGLYGNLKLLPLDNHMI